jgi:CubicO group peptidase (beta-lactamase class C family)
MQREHVQGLALATIDNGAVVHVAAYGIRNAARDSLTTQTIMYGASLTKTAFTYLVMQLVDEGRLDLDASIADLLPRPLPEYDDYHDLAGDGRWKALTLRILLTHTSGFANLRSLEDDGKLRFHTIPAPATVTPERASTSPNWCSRRPCVSMSDARCRPACSTGSTCRERACNGDRTSV